MKIWPMTDNLAPPDDSEAAKLFAGKHLPRALIIALFVGGLAVTGVAISEDAMRIAAGLLWSLAFCAIGVLLGFIFAIPRVSGNTNGKPEATAPASGGSEDETAKKTRLTVTSEVNTNLVEVSDWLTKIIVGVGLVELKQIPDAARSMAEFMAPSLGVGDSWAAALACAIMLYFAVSGFIAGYLMTRVYLALMFKRAEILASQEGQSVRLESGREIDVSKLSELQQTAIEDLQRQVASIAKTTGNLMAEESLGSVVAPSKRVLWVDDHPDNNTLYVEQLVRDGAKVEQVLSTKQALASLGRTDYDVIVSDMSRTEDGVVNDKAGVELTAKVKQSKPQLDIFIYCSRRMAQRYGIEAQSAGARLVTSSGMRLISELRGILGLGS